MLSEVVSEGDSCWFQCLNKRPSQCLKWLSLPFENTAEKAGREPSRAADSAGPWSGSSSLQTGEKISFCCWSHTVYGILTAAQEWRSGAQPPVSDFSSSSFGWQHVRGQWGSSASRVWLFMTSWTVACWAPLSMGFPRQEHWSGLPFRSPVDLPNAGIEPTSPALVSRFFYCWTTRQSLLSRMGIL